MTSIRLLGIPHDENSSHLRGAADAPAPIRAEMFSDAYSLWTETGVDLGAQGRIEDLGDITFSDDRDPWEVITARVSEALAGGFPLLSLGGDHAITHPILRVVRKNHRRLTILHIDAHADIYDDFQDNPRSHASPFARIMEEGLADRLVQVGLRTINDQHRDQFARFGVEVVEARHFERALALNFEGPVYVSFDMDGLDPAFAPGVSHREPGGLSVRQVLDLFHTIKAPVIAADIVEYNPRCDLGGVTATVAAKLAKELAGLMALGAR